MKIILARFFLVTFRYFYYFSYQSFLNSFKKPKKIQEKLKTELFFSFQKSPLASQHPHVTKFEDIPLMDYDDLEPFLSQKEVIYEYTSGSSGKNKKIPYTKELLGSFRKMFLLWAYDLCLHIPFKSLTCYFSISPHLSRKGDFNTDQDYLGSFWGKVLSPFLIQSSQIKNLQSEKDFYPSLINLLTQHRDLEIISVWSPSFLMLMLDQVEEENLKEMFPQLKIISVWGDGHAVSGYKKIQKLFPDVTVQKKGLLATEAPLTIPLINVHGHVPLISECYFEFLDNNGTIQKLWDLNQGKTYEVIISQKGGLIRYKLKDLVRVTHFFHQTPCLQFIGRSGEISDLVGEKLSSLQVQDAIRDTPVKHVLPDQEDSCYYLLTEGEVEDKTLTIQIEQSLCRNIHYSNARKLTQLGPLRWWAIPSLSEKLMLYYEKKRSQKRRSKNWAATP